MRFKPFIVFAVLLGVALPAHAEGSILDKAVNNPNAAWSAYGALKIDYIKDDAVTGGTAERVAIAGKSANPWDVGANANNIKPIKNGDVLLVAFWAKAAELPEGSSTIEITGSVSETAAPWAPLGPYEPLHIGSQWKIYYFHGVAAKDYDPNAVRAALHLATAKQTIDFGPNFILDFGPGYDVSKLPHN